MSLVPARLKIATSLGVPVAALRKGAQLKLKTASGKEQHVWRGIADSASDARSPAKDRQSPSWLITQPDAYRAGYRLCQVTIVVLMARVQGRRVRDGNELAELSHSAAQYLRALPDYSSDLTFEQANEAHEQALLAARQVHGWSSAEADAVRHWLLDNRNVRLAPGALDEPNWYRVFQAMEVHRYDG